MKKFLTGLFIGILLSTSNLVCLVTQSTTVYLVNNTPFPLSLETTRTRGPALDPDHFKILHDGSISPFAQKTPLCWFSRNEGITSDVTYDFATTMSFDKENSITAYQSITGAPKILGVPKPGSTMVQSLSGTNLSHALQDTEETGPRYTVWNLPGFEINVTYERYFTGGSDDIQIVLDYTHPAPQGSENPNILNLLTYNLYMRPHLLFKNGQAERAQRIPDYVDGYDGIIFQEAFDDDARQKLLDGLKTTYPYQTKVVGSPVPSGKETNGGVVMVSKHPISTEDHIIYADCSGSDCLAAKGAQYIKIHKMGVPYHIFGTHTNAWDEPEGIAARKEEFKELHEFIESKNIPANEPILIAGDMNVNMVKYPDEYREMIKTLNATHPPRTGFKDTDGNFYTVHPKTNKLVAQDYPEFLDYILYENDHKKPVSSFNEVIPLKTRTGWKEYAFETEYFDLSDHYPVYGHFEFQ